MDCIGMFLESRPFFPHFSKKISSSVVEGRAFLFEESN
jgi:hypothetical protein